MNRRALILEALQLSPLWVRRELLQTEPDTIDQTSIAPIVNEPAPGVEPGARHPLPNVALAANKVLAPLISPAEHRHAEPANIVPASDSSHALSIAGLGWDALQLATRECEACSLCKSRNQAVFGVGNPHADLLVVGEAPGEEEDRLGEPFVGRAGKLLDNMLAAIREKRGDRVYIANVLKCRPPGNRNPQPDEITQCSPYLLRQLELIAPKVILASGRFAAQTLLGSTAPISALRGKVHTWRGIPLIVTYHPAYLLRNLPDKNKAWDDLLLLRSILDNRSSTA